MAFYWVKLGVAFRGITVPLGQPTPTFGTPLLYNGVAVTNVYDPTNRPATAAASTQGIDLLYTNPSGTAYPNSLVSVSANTLLSGLPTYVTDANGNAVQTGTQYLSLAFSILDIVATNPDAIYSVGNQLPSTTMEGPNVTGTIGSGTYTVSSYEWVRVVIDRPSMFTNADATHLGNDTVNLDTINAYDYNYSIGATSYPGTGTTTFQFDGGSGDDIITLPQTAARWTYLTGIVPVTSTTNGTVAAPFVVHGGDGNDTFFGSNLVDNIDGGAGNDTFNSPYALGTNGRLYLDALRGGAGNDTYLLGLGVANGVIQDRDEDYTYNAPWLDFDIVRINASASDSQFNPSTSGYRANYYSIGYTSYINTSGFISYQTNMDLLGIEKVVFEQPLTSYNAITPFGGSIYSELADLARDVYGARALASNGGNSAVGRDYYYATLGWQTPDRQNGEDDPFFMRLAPDKAPGNWREVSAAELGMSMRSVNTVGNLGVDDAGNALAQASGYTFAYGEYLSGSTNWMSKWDAVVTPFVGDHVAQANAWLLEGLVDGTQALSVSFRGTNQLADFGDYTNFQNHYEKFRPLINGIISYLGDHPNEKIYLDGHSLGGAMVQYLAHELAPFGNRVVAFTMGSPGAEAGITASNVVNLVHTDDAVPWISGKDATTLSNVVKVLLGAVVAQTPDATLSAIYNDLVQQTFLNKTRTGIDILIDRGGTDDRIALGLLPGISEHSQDKYDDSMLQLVTAAKDLTSPFSKSAFGIALATDQAYTGPSIRISLSDRTVSNSDLTSTGWQTSHADRDTNMVMTHDTSYVLMGGGDDILVLNQDINATFNFQKIDGGSGNDTIYLTNFSRSVFDVGPTQADGSIALTYTPLIGAHSAPIYLYNVEHIIFAGGVSVDLTGAATTVQTRAPGQTSFQLQAGYTYADAGQGGTVTVSGTNANDQVYGVSGGRQFNMYQGGDDSIFLFDAADAASAGVNTVFFGTSTGHAVFMGANGQDTVYGGNGTNSFSGGDGADKLYGGTGADMLDGGNGDDLLSGGAGADTLKGGAGSDTVTFASTSVGVSLSLAAGIGTAGDALGDTYDSIENVIGSFGADVIFGDAGANILSGGAGNDFLSGDAGNDTLDGGSGIDKLFGGAGDDIIVYDANDDLANVLGGDGVDTLLINNGAAPTGFDLAAHQFEQAQVHTVGAATGQTFNYRDDYYTAAWQLRESDTVNTDGSRSQTLYDVAGAQAWSQVTTYYNASNQTTLQSISNDDATSRAIYFDPTDAAHPTGVQPWKSADTFYDTLGRTTLQSIANDDGTFRATYYDPGNLQPWISADTFYNTAGTTTLQSIANDDGTSQVQYWDTTNTQPWSTAVLHYNAAGTLTLTQGVYDNGTTFSF